MYWEYQDERCRFEAFESPKEGKPVQSWFDGLPEEHREHIKETLAFLQVTPPLDWPETSNFDPLIGEGGISEIRFDPLTTGEGRFYYRMYGVFGTEEEQSYKFLHGTNKKVKNDKPGKARARKRLAEVLSFDSKAGFTDFRMD